jgi:predicted nucleic acid-binding protein
VIFVDTSFWAALRNPKDAHRGQAVALWRCHAQQPLLTSNHVIGETWTLLRRRADHRRAVEFLTAVDASARVAVQHVGAQTELRALDWLRRHDEREYSFVDATSFALMREMRIGEALAFDGDFAAAGFLELRD